MRSKIRGFFFIDIVLMYQIRKTYLRWPEGVEDEESIAYVDQMEVIENHVPSNEPELRD